MMLHFLDLSRAFRKGLASVTSCFQSRSRYQLLLGQRLAAAQLVHRGRLRWKLFPKRFYRQLNYLIGAYNSFEKNKLRIAQPYIRWLLQFVSIGRYYYTYLGELLCFSEPLRTSPQALHKNIHNDFFLK